MPTASQKRRQASSQGASQAEASQGSQRRGRGRRREPDDDGDRGEQSSQAKNALSKGEKDRKVADFIRYMLFMDSKKTAVKRADLNKNVLKEHTRAFVPVFQEAQKRMRKIFGYELIETEQNKQKVYILINKIQEEPGQEIVFTNPHDLPRLGLLLIILAVIFMNDDVIAEGLLWDTLKRLGVVKGEVHDIFGDVEKLVSLEYVKQMYLDRKKIITGDTATFEYRWGLRAQHEMTKRKALEFVAQVYDVEVQAWTKKFKEVQEEEEERASDSD